MDVTFNVQPAINVEPSDQNALINVDAVYSQTAPALDDQLQAPVTQTERILLDRELKGATVLENVEGREIRADVLSLDGSVIFSRTVSVDNLGRAVLTMTQEEVARCQQSQQKMPEGTAPLVSKRQVRLVPTNDSKVDYMRSTVMVSPIADLDEIGAANLEAILKVAGNKPSSVEVTGQQLEPLTHIPWIAAHLAVDGTFTCSFPKQASVGWLWWLTGVRQVIGYVPDDLTLEVKPDLAIPLPALVLAPIPPESVAKSDGECGCEKMIPRDVTESELINNPGVYTEDPGSFCKPFSNPERVLSEKSFKVIARVQAPQIGAAGSRHTRSVNLLSAEENKRNNPFGPGLIGRAWDIFFPPPTDYRKGRGGTPTRQKQNPKEEEFLKGLPSGRNRMDSKHPLQWEDDIAQYQASNVCLGHILEFRVRWRSNGYSLGKVAKTLTLAPRQARRIQKISWERSERARRREVTRLTDIENDSTTRERDYDDHVSAHLDEWASGSSHSDMAGVAGGIGFLAGPVLGGIGGGAAASNSSSQQDGGRNTSASEHQRLRDSIRRHGDALRKFESTVVNEVEEEENVTGTTEVIRNLNYAHSLTVIYYQILRHLRVDTEFAGVRECLFVPFSIKPFDIARAYRWREAIQSAIRSRRFLRALRYLKDVDSNFATSEIPEGTRAAQPLTFLRGSIFVNLGIERPKDSDDGSYDDSSWNPFKHLLDTPALGIFSQLAQLVGFDRDRHYQANFASSVAARWANRLQLIIGGQAITIDSTLATRYQFNRGVRIDFVVPPGQLSGLTRNDLNNVTVQPNDDLPPGSVANLTRMSLTYTTERFERSVQARTGVNDLISPVHGGRAQAALLFPLDAWESVNERAEITRSVEDRSNISTNTLSTTTKRFGGESIAIAC